MNVFPDSNWLKALEMKGSTAAAVFAASVLILLLSELELLYLQTLPPWARAIVVIFGIVSFAVFSASVWDWGHGVRKDKRQQAKNLCARKRIERSVRRRFSAT